MTMQMTEPQSRQQKPWYRTQSAAAVGVRKSLPEFIDLDKETGIQFHGLLNGQRMSLLSSQRLRTLKGIHTGGDETNSQEQYSHDDSIATVGYDRMTGAGFVSI
jgi:hypothetical protein